MAELHFDPKENYLQSGESIGYVERKKATQQDYDRIGFKSGLEVHQQLLTKEKLFCHCPAGLYQKAEQFDAEIIRHMRPTLSELGEYDGTALMEFKTKKEIIYRIKNETTCTYEIDDTPPFPVDREAMGIAIEISLLSNLNIVGEVHITRKQYLDGSIPTGFQRTGIIGVEGKIQLRNKTVRLIQLSLEEDSCREVSDIAHTRIYRTDRLGMPLIETVTYPDCVNPDEVKEACDYIRFLNRSTGKVRTGIGAGRQDVNVSCRGGSRVEIKGVAHTKWIPELTHNEAFRQYALLKIREILTHRNMIPENWKIHALSLHDKPLKFASSGMYEAMDKGYHLYAINLPGFARLLSHFTQPGKIFADEICERLKVIACLEPPFMTHSEAFEPVLQENEIDLIRKLLSAGENDAQIIIWGQEGDMKTALETIEERCKMAFVGVPNETRKSFEDGTTIFERVLPGADRMYPDTDSAPIPLAEEYIMELRKNLPSAVNQRYLQLKKWGIPEDTYTYIFSKNLYPLVERLITGLEIDPVFAGTFLGQTLKFIEGHYKTTPAFTYEMIFNMFAFLRQNHLQPELAEKMIPVLYEHPQMDFESILLSINFKRIPAERIISNIQFLKDKFAQIRRKNEQQTGINWIMGHLRSSALGNISLKDLAAAVKEQTMN